MTLAELRRELKAIGYKVKLSSVSFGRVATYTDLDGNIVPSIFFGEDTRQQVIDLIEYRQNNRDRLKEFGKANGIVGLPL